MTKPNLSLIAEDNAGTLRLRTITKRSKRLVAEARAERDTAAIGAYAMAGAVLIIGIIAVVLADKCDRLTRTQNNPRQFFATSLIRTN